MAEKRRLQGEVDRVLKKVYEGRATFKDTLEKFEAATNTSQKEKHETELKKEIKKLQRLRDNIKTWLQSPDIKDKSSLTDARRNIESDMEKFKIIEKETKTKAYSKEGLYTELKKDPMLREKEENLEWLKSEISRFQKNVEQCEFELLSLTAIKRKKNADKEKISDLNQKLSMYRGHLGKLETLMRLIDNDKIELDKVREFKTNVYDDFIENPDRDMFKVEQGLFIYDELNLDELSVDISINPDLDLISPTTKSELEPLTIPPLTNSSIISSTISTIAIPPVTTVLSIATSSVASTAPAATITTEKSVELEETTLDMSSEQKVLIKSVKKKSRSNILDTNTPNDTAVIKIPQKSIVTSSNEVVADNETTSVAKTATTPVFETVSSIESSGSREQSLISNDVVKSTQSDVVYATQTSIVSTQASSVPMQMPVNPPRNNPHPPATLPTTPNSSPSTNQLNSQFQQLNLNQYPTASVSSRPIPDSLNPSNPTGSSAGSIGSSSGVGNNSGVVNNGSFNLILDCGDAMSPFRNSNFMLTEYARNQCSAMDQGKLKHDTVQPTDFEKSRMIIYKHDCPVPESFPTEPPPYISRHNNATTSPSDLELQEEYYYRLDSDTLFFIFYYFEGSRAQYLAAKALKRMSWRFHTGHMCWFQRHEEPKKITENSESGTYIFYDFENMCKQKKENFTFSYNYLEDNDF